MIPVAGFPGSCSVVFTNQPALSPPKFARNFLVTDKADGNQLGGAAQFYEIGGFLLVYCGLVKMPHHFIETGNPSNRFNGKFAVMKQQVLDDRLYVGTKCL